MRIFALSIGLFVSLFVLSSAFATESESDRLLDLLVEKGAVTKEEAAGLRAESAIKKQEGKEKQTEFPILSGRPVRLAGYLQLRYRHDPTIEDTFDIRRARLDLKGDLTGRLDYRLQAEFAGTSVKLLDAAIGYSFDPALKMTAGQFKIPFSLENLTPSPKLETINRSQVVEALVARGKDVIGNQNGRDIGVQASGGFFQREGAYLFDYAVGVFDGAGINTADTNEQKDITGRLVIHPVKDLSAGASFYKGRFTLPATPSINDKRERYGAEFAYVHDPISFKGEYIKGRDGSTYKDGWYLQAAYFILPTRLQAVFKFDTFDPDTKKKKDETDVYTLGANLYFNQWSFLQVNYEDKVEHGAKVNNNAATGQLTLQF